MVLFLGLIFFLLTWCFGCAAHATLLRNTPGPDDSVAGFWIGLWHGFILPFTFIISLFSDINVYEVHNNGGWYNCGFFIGAAMILGGSASGASAARGGEDEGDEEEEDEP